MRTGKLIRASVVGVMVVVAGGCAGKNYNKIMTEAVRRSLGHDTQGYGSFSYPTNNFGLITSHNPAPGERVSDLNFVCDSWNCIDVPDNSIPRDSSWLSMKGFAGVGTGGTITLSEKDKRTIALRAALPQIAQVVGVNGVAEASRLTSTSVQLGRVHQRKLRREEFARFIGNLPPDRQLREAFNQGQLTIAVADYVIDGFSVTVGVDNTTAAALDAKLAQVPSQIFSNADLGVKVSQATQGTYTFQVTQPVVILRLMKRQPAAGALGATGDDDWTDWQEVAEPPVEKRRTP